MGDILELDIPLDYFSNGIQLHYSREAVKNHCPLYISFLVWGGLFFPPMKTERAMALSIISSLKSLEDYMFRSMDFA